MVTESLNNIIPIESIQERDIDLLILEEIKCNKNFTDWIIKNTIKIENYKLIGAWHSLTQVDLGESDLAFKIKAENKEIIYLIENKINADFQPNQAKRYQQRGNKRIKNGECDEFYTMLIAPQKYITKNQDFNFYIEYEDIKKWFKNQINLGERGKYKAEIIKIAIEKLRRGYSPIINKDATDFWWCYYEFANKNHPHLEMRKPPKGIPKKSGFMTFSPKDIGLEKDDKIIHKTYGVVDLQLAGKASKLEELHKKYSKKLTNDMEIVKAGKSASIRISVDKLSTTSSFEEQLEKIKLAFEKVNKLYNWAKENL